MKRVLTYLFLFSNCLFAFACSEFPTERPQTPQPTPIPTLAPLAEKIDTELHAEIERIAQDARGKIGVGALMIETGDAVYLERGEQFPMQSVYKLPIAMAVLKMVDDGKVRLDQEITITPDDFVRWGFHSPIRNVNPQGTVLPLGEILRYSISESDGTASDVLLDLAGGPAAVQNYLSTIGIKDMIIADSEKSISKDWETQYRNWATPEDSVKLLRAIYERRAGLSDLTTNILLRVMTETETGEDRLRKGIPEGATIAHKTGTGGTRNRITGATNDIGIITLPDGRHIAIAVFIRDSAADTRTREKVMADIARAVCDKWSGRRGDQNE